MTLLPPGPPEPAGPRPTVRLVRPAPAPLTSTTGPKVLVVAGVLLLIASLAALAAVATTFARLLPLEVLATDGGLGTVVVASARTPGTLTAELDASTGYALFLAQPEPAGRTGLDGALVVTGPGGSPVDLSVTGVSASTSQGGVAAHTVGSFRTTTTGTYTVSVPAMLDGSDSAVHLAPGIPTGPFLSGVLGTIVGVLVVLVLAPLGIAGVVGGGLWWRVRARAANAAGPSRDARPGDLG